LAKNIGSGRPPARKQLIEELSDAFRLAQTLNQAFDELAAQILGVNMTDLRVLDAIQRLGMPTAGEVATETGLTSGAMTAVIDRLAKVGYLERVADPDDRRRVRLAITPDALQRMWAIWEPLATDYAASLDDLSDDELRTFVAFMRRGEDVGREQIARLRALVDARS
jgi:DNA-binding MarR family transcriptional regulator